MPFTQNQFPTTQVQRRAAGSVRVVGGQGEAGFPFTCPMSAWSLAAVTMGGGA